MLPVTPLSTDFGSTRGLRVRHEATQLARLVYDAAGAMPRGTRGDLADQLRRAAQSVHANLAEGEGRASQADRVAFFRFAWASLRELEAHLSLAQVLGLLAPATVPALRIACRHVGRLLHALLRSTTALPTAVPARAVPSPPSPSSPSHRSVPARPEPAPPTHARPEPPAPGTPHPSPSRPTR